MLNLSKIRSRKLQFDILGGFFALLIITMVAVIGYLSWANHKAVMRFSERLIERISQNSIERTIDFFDEVEDITVQSTLAINAEGEVKFENRNLVNYMLGVLKTYNQVSLMYAATEGGIFLQAVRLPEGQTYRAHTKKLPGKVKFAIRIVDRSKEMPEEIWRYVDENGKVIDVESLSKVMYDHKVRPWYIKTMQSQNVYWSDIYIFNTFGIPGVTVAAPLKDDKGVPFGVIAADISIMDLTKQLDNNRIGKEGVAFIVSSNDALVAHPDPSLTTRKDESGVRSTVISELKNDPIRYAYQNFTLTEQNHAIVEFNGRSYMSNFTKFPIQFGTQWYVGIVVPTEYFTHDIDESHFNSLLICALILVISTVMIMWFARTLSNPIVSLSEEAENIRNFKLDNQEEIKSSISEIQLLNNAIVAMRKSMRAFSKFVPKRLVQKVLDRGMEVKTGGRPREVTLMFTDIAGFTSVSEGYDSEKLALHLSDYFENLSRIVVDNNGTIDKYIGDAIMAFWGAPVADKRHTLNACRTSLSCQKRLEELNRKWTSEGKPQLHTRIGLHAGSPIVGYMGSSERINYTAIGDDVNLAARLEGANKFYGTHILISEEVYERVAKEIVARPLDIVAVKGKNKGVKVYELIALNVAKQKGDAALLPSDEQREFCEKSTKAFQLYREQRWDECIKQVDEITQKYGKDGASALLRERSVAFKKTPPPKNWDGIYRLQEK